MDQTAETEHKVRRVRRTKAQIEADNAAKPKLGEAMNAYAMRIWNGQSPDLLTQERVARIVAGLKAQGYTNPTGLKLPVADLDKYL